MKKEHRKIINILNIFFIILGYFFAANVFAEGKYDVKNKEDVYRDQNDWTRSTMEAYSDNGVNYIKVTVMKEDLSADPDYEFKNIFRCNGSFIVQTNLRGGYISLSDSPSFSSTSPSIQYERKTSLVEFYFLIDEVIYDHWETGRFFITNFIEENSNLACNNDKLFTGPFTIFYKEEKPTTQPDEIDPPDDPQPVVTLEKPTAPELYAIAVSLASDQCTLKWRKVIDTQYDHNANYYVIEYRKKYREWDTATIINAGDPSTGSNLYETLSYTVSALDDDTTYYFRVKAVNDTGDGYWSNEQYVRVAIEDKPYFMPDHFPEENADNVSKTPELRWDAFDKDGDDLDYYVTIRETGGIWTTLRAFKDSNHQGSDIFNFSQEYHKPLKPGTSYEWQIWVRENGRSKDYYGGDYIKSPVRSFTTELTGADPSIIRVEQIGEIKPDTDVLFKVTIKNIGTESIGTQLITTAYLKNNQESPFYHGSGRTTVELESGQEETIDVEVRFMDSIWERNGNIYDNVLMPGESQIKFFFSKNDDQDINPENNAFLQPIEYEDKGGPVIERLYIDEYGKLGDNPTTNFWARAGHGIHISFSAYDDVRLVSALIETKLHASDSYVTLEEWTNDDDSFSTYTDWLIPENTQTTHEAQIRITLVDDQNNETIKEIAPFSIYSNNINATIQPVATTYKAGNLLEYNISNTSDHAIESIEVEICLGSYCDNIGRFSNDNGLTVQPQYQWSIPSGNEYVSQNRYLKMNIRDIRGNSKEVESNNFVIEPDTELPPPFNESITLFDEELQYPEGSSETRQESETIFVELDSNNIVHTIVRHTFSYNMDSPKHKEHIHTYIDKKYYITYSKSTNAILEKVLLCDKNYRVIDFELVSNIPHVVLEKMDHCSWWNYGFNQYYYTYKQGDSFVQPVNIINPTIPTISSGILKGERCTGDLTKVIYLNNYLWYLRFENYIKRYSFSNGQIGEEESLYVTNNFGDDLGSYDIKPSSDGNIIYFIDRYESKLVKLDTASLIVDGYDLPFEIGDDRTANRTSIAAMNGKAFIFGNGKIYVFENNSVSELMNISYTFNSEIADYSSNWNETWTCTALKGDGIIHLIINTYDDSIPKPQRTACDFLEFNPYNNQLSKRIIGTTEYQYNTIGFSDIMYVGNNKALMIATNSTPFDRNHFNYLRMIDFTSGDINYLGNLKMKNISYPSLLSVNNQFYAIGENNEVGGYHSDCYAFNLQNNSINTKKVDSIQLLKRNNELYVTWLLNGDPFDGTWDSSTEKRTKSYSSRKNQFIKIYPGKGNITNFSESYVWDELSFFCSDNLIIPNDGKMYSLNNDLTVGELIEEVQHQGSIIPNIFSSDIKAAFSDWSSNIFLFGDDFSTPIEEINDNPGRDNIVGVYDDEVISIGEGKKSPYYGRYVIKKYDLTTQHDSTIFIDNYVRDYDTHKADINSNKYVAVAWDNYIAVGDFSGDVIAPTVSITSTGGKVSQGDTISLQWQASDNKDELIRFEIFKNGNSTPIATITDVNISNYEDTITEANGKLTYTIKAYDLDENSNYDSIDFTVFTPATFNSFTANKSTLEIGEKIIFTWDAVNADESTNYTIYKKKVDSSNWETYFSVQGMNNHRMIVDGFIGDYEFMISADGNTMQLTDAIHIDGEIVEFNENAFSKAPFLYYLENPTINLTWGINGNLSDIVVFDLYIKQQGEANFQQIASTSNLSYIYTLPENKNDTFEWKLIAQFRGDQYESEIFQTQLKQLISPDVTSVQLINHHSMQPSTVISFTPFSEIKEYAIMRRDSDGNYLEIGRSESGIYTDATVQYDTQYEYSICAISDTLIGDPGATRDIMVSIKPIQFIFITNANHTVLSSDSITIQYMPDSGNCFERYEILTGNHPDEMKTYTITHQRTIRISDIDYGSTAYVQIFPLNHINERIAFEPAQVSFELPYQETDLDIKTTDINDSEAVITWSKEIDETGWVRYGLDIEDLSNWQTAYDIRGKDIEDELHYIKIESLNPNTVYFYEVISGNYLDNNNGQYFSLTTGPSLSNHGSCQIAGSIYSDNVNTPIDHAIVYVTIPGTEKSSTGSFLITPENNGRWWFELVNLRTINHQQFYNDYTCGESEVLLEVEAGKQGTDRIMTKAIPYVFDQPDSVIADLVPEQDHIIDISHGSFGTVFPNESVSIKHHSDIKISIIADTGYHISQILVDGQPIEISSTYTFDQISENHSIHVNFAINTYAIETQSGAGGNISPSSSMNYSDTYHVNIDPDIGFHITDVMIDGISIGPIESYTFSNICHDHTISAFFEINEYTISTSVGLNGIISPSANVQHGTDYSVSLTPSEGYHVLNVIIDDMPIGDVTSYTFNDITSSHHITAEFRINSYSIQTSAGENGTISHSASIYHGDDYAIQITPAIGYHVSNVLVDGISVDKEETYIFNDVKGNHTINAEFEINRYQISTSKISEGSISPSASIPYGKDYTVVFKPATGYHIFDIRVDGQSIGPVTEYHFNNITSTHMVEAEFAINEYTITCESISQGEISPSIVVSHGDTYTVLISPDEGFYVLNIIIDGESIGQKNEYVFEDIAADHKITAFFQQYAYSINANALFGGTITSSGDTSILWGESMSYNIHANEGYIIYDVIVDGVSQGSISTYTFPDVQEEHTIQAVFAAEYHLYPGWNLISLSFVPETPYTSETLAKEINQAGGSVEIIQSWNGSLSTHNVGATFSFFPIEMGRGYFLRCDQESTWVNVGTEWTAEAYQYKSGFNLLGFPNEYSMMASELADMINHNNSHLQKIQKWNGSDFETYTASAPFGDFKITNLNGYFLLFTESGEFEINP